jgi:hypothetical protein
VERRPPDERCYKIVGALQWPAAQRPILRTAMILAFIEDSGCGVIAPAQHTYLRERGEPSSRIEELIRHR